MESQNTLRSLSWLLLMFVGIPVQGAMLSLGLFSPNYSGGFISFAYDPPTQTYYAYQGYDAATATPLRSYATGAAFYANTPTTSIPLTGGAPHGTYFSVLDGSFYAHDSEDLPSVSKWDVATGALQAKNALSQFDATNGTATFNFGGFSAMNIFRDNSHLYLFAKSASTGLWTISKLNPDLTVSNTLPTNLSTVGWAFLVNGKLYVGDHYSTHVITHAIDVNNGHHETVNIEFSNSLIYISNTVYDENLDRLYVFSGGSLYYLENAASTLENGVPEPGTGTLLGAALLTLGWICLRPRLRSH